MIAMVPFLVVGSPTKLDSLALSDPLLCQNINKRKPTRYPHRDKTEIFPGHMAKVKTCD